jgi:hypothetical protein
VYGESVLAIEHTITIAIHMSNNICILVKSSQNAIFVLHAVSVACLTIRIVVYVDDRTLRSFPVIETDGITCAVETAEATGSCMAKAVETILQLCSHVIFDTVTRSEEEESSEEQNSFHFD